MDTRADIWSFGVILYELTTGHKPFTGEDLADTLATVVKIDPDFTRVPARVRRLVQACLQKDPQQRLQAIGDMRLLLSEEIVPGPAPEPVIIEVKPKLPWLWAAVAAVFAIAAGLATWMWRGTPPPEFPSVQFDLAPPPGEDFTNTGASFAVSPDGRYAVYAARGKGQAAFWLRALDSSESRPLTATATAGQVNFPTWSPDSKSIAYRDSLGPKLKRVDIAGGAALTLADIGDEGNVGATGTWNQDGVILFGGIAGIRKVSASGGGATQLTKVDAKLGETGHGFPQFLPDGNRFLYFAASPDANVQGVYASSLDNPRQRTLIVRTDAKGVYVPPKGPAPGYLLWMQDDNLVAQRFNLDKLEREGEPVSVAENVTRNSANPIRATFWASEAGLLLYRTGTEANVQRPIVWIARDGKQLGEALPLDDNATPRLSPDGRLLAVQRRDPQGIDVYTWEFDRSVATRLTFQKDNETIPVWSPDSKQIAFLWQGKGLFRMDATGVGSPQPLLNDPATALFDWSSDGKFVLFRYGSALDYDVWAAPVAAPGQSGGKPVPLVTGPSTQALASVSPNGKWVAYTSNESNPNGEVYIRPFSPGSSGAGSRWQASNAGGSDPVWRGDSKELYYETSAGEIMAVALREEGQGLKLEAPKLLFKADIETGQAHSFDATADGGKFVVQLRRSDRNADAAATRVVTNWQSALRK